MLITMFGEKFDTGDVSRYEVDYQLLLEVWLSSLAIAAVACLGSIRCPVTLATAWILYFLGF